MNKRMNLIWLAAAAMGCHGSVSTSELLTNPIQRYGNTAPDMTNPTPMIVDQAMQLRDWNQSPSVYPSGDTIAGATGFNYRPNDNQPKWRYGLVETPLFVAQSVALPVTLAITPPWQAVRSTGATIEPTYTAMPVLPPSPGASEESVPTTPAVNDLSGPSGTTPGVSPGPATISTP